MNPVITKMEHFAINDVLNVVGLLDPPLHCNKFTAKAVSWFKPERMVIYTCVPWREVFE